MTSKWDQIFADHAKVEGSGVITPWVDLRRKLSGIITDDLIRTAWGTGYATGPNDQPMLARLRDAFFDCSNSPTCRMPALAEFRTWIDRQPSYRTQIATIESTQNVHDVRRALDRLGMLIDEDIRFYYGFRTNPSIRREAGAALLPILPIGLEFAAEHLSKYIEPAWSGAGFTLKLDWKSSGGLEIFKLLLGQGLDGRAFVDHSKKEINLFPDVRAGTITHEFGHVLGFPDRYYTIWDDSKCEYTFGFNPSDVMSNSRTGSVRAADIDQLRRTYMTKSLTD